MSEPANPNEDYTGGHYSLYRAIFGTYLLVHFVALVPWAGEMFSRQGVLPDGNASPVLRLFPNLLAVVDSPAVVTALVALAAVLCVPFVLGYRDRFAAIGIWYVWACLFGRNPLIANPGLPFVGWLLLAHAFLPPAPWGSWARRALPDPGARWRVPAAIHAVAWILMALGYSYSGYTKLVSPSWLDGTAIARVLESPLARPGLARTALLALPDFVLRGFTWSALALELAFAPLALVRRLRPWLWSALLALHLSLIVLIDFADLSLGMVMLHLFTFRPSWVRPRSAQGSAVETVFYDGHCGLCHRLVRFALSEDTRAAFRFSPLQNGAFRAAASAYPALATVDSVVVRTASGELLTKSAAVLYVGARFGGAWRVLAAVVGILPRSFVDGAYDLIARIRHRLFARPADACPIVPPELRERFI